MSLIRHRRRTFLLDKETGMQKCAGMLVETGKAFMDPSAMMTQMRGLRHLEFATFNDLVLANTFGHHKASRRWKWHSPNGQHHNQNWLHFSEEALPIRSEHCQNTKFSRSRHWKWSRLADDDFPPSPEKKKSASQNTQDSSLTSKSWKIPMCWKPSKLW